MRELIEPIQTMTSREMAVLTEKRHDSVKRTIGTLAERGAIGVPQVVEYLDPLGRPAQEYRVGKRDSYVIVAQLSPEFTARLVDRWQELEAKQEALKPQVPLSYAEALRLAADQAERLEAQAQALRVTTPKAIVFDAIHDLEGMKCIRDAAKTIGVFEGELIAKLIEQGWAYRREGSEGGTGRLRAGDYPLRKGYFVHKEVKGRDRKAHDQLMVTVKGLQRLTYNAFETWGLRRKGEIPKPAMMRAANRQRQEAMA